MLWRAGIVERGSRALQNYWASTASKLGVLASRLGLGACMIIYMAAHVAASVQRGESKAVDGVFAILGLPRVEGPLTAQITLPLCHGGLGLSHSCPAEGSAAYLAATAIAHKAMRHGTKAFRPFDVPSGEQLRPQWVSLHSRA
jgi:hypothetical protein